MIAVIEGVFGKGDAAENITETAAEFARLYAVLQD
jgi:hypothetical protein